MYWFEIDGYGEPFIGTLKDLPTRFHYIQAARERLKYYGFTELFEHDEWDSLPSRFFVVAEEQHLMAFDVVDWSRGVFLQVNSAVPHLELEKNFFVSAGCEQCTVKHCGSTDWTGWLDHDLTLAGYAYVKGQGMKLVDLKKPVCMIPSLAVHLRPGSGLKGEFKPGIHFRPIFSLKQPGEECDTVLKLLAEHLKCSKEDIEDYRLDLIPAEQPTLFGEDGKMLASYGICARLGSVPGLLAFLEPGRPESGLKCFASIYSDGKGEMTGGISFFLRILERLGFTESFYEQSLLISVEHFAQPGRTKKGLGWGKGTYFHKCRKEQLLLGDKMDLFTQALEMCCVSCPPAVGYEVLVDTIATIIATRTNMQAIRIGIPIGCLDSIREYANVRDIGRFALVAKTALNSLFREPEKPE